MNALQVMEQSLLLDQSHILKLLSMHMPFEYEDGLSMNVELELGMLTWKWMKMFMDDNFSMDEWHSSIWMKFIF
jgi:hypothetical protein